MPALLNMETSLYQSCDIKMVLWPRDSMTFDCLLRTVVAYKDVYDIGYLLWQPFHQPLNDHPHSRQSSMQWQCFARPGKTNVTKHNWSTDNADILNTRTPTNCILRRITVVPSRRGPALWFNPGHWSAHLLANGLLLIHEINFLTIELTSQQFEFRILDLKVDLWAIASSSSSQTSSLMLLAPGWPACSPLATL